VIAVDARGLADLGLGVACGGGDALLLDGGGPWMANGDAAAGAGSGRFAPARSPADNGEVK